MIQYTVQHQACNTHLASIQRHATIKSKNTVKEVLKVKKVSHAYKELYKNKHFMQLYILVQKVMSILKRLTSLHYSSLIRWEISRKKNIMNLKGPKSHKIASIFKRNLIIKVKELL